jgi:ketopantoate hydroxymethyltransferase
MKISDIEINIVANPLAHRVTARIKADQLGLGAEVDSDLLDNNLICKV